MLNSNNNDDFDSSDINSILIKEQYSQSHLVPSTQDQTAELSSRNYDSKLSNDNYYQSWVGLSKTDQLMHTHISSSRPSQEQILNTKARVKVIRQHLLPPRNKSQEKKKRVLELLQQKAIQHLGLKTDQVLRTQENGLCLKPNAALIQSQQKNESRFKRKYSRKDLTKEECGSDYLSVQRYHSNQNRRNLDYTGSNSRVELESLIPKLSTKIKQEHFKYLLKNTPIKLKGRQISFKIQYQLSKEIRNTSCSYAHQNLQPNINNSLASLPKLMLRSSSRQSITQRSMAQNSINKKITRLSKERRNQIRNLVFKIDDVLNEENQIKKSFIRDKENDIGLINMRLDQISSKINDNLQEQDLYDSRFNKVFSEEERLEAIGQMRKDIDDTGYAFKSNKRKFPLNHRQKLINLVNKQRNQNII
ncbi:UNKNOWN [Stylonychia lemnae]|uniref:Uncharacterized protein n=1 Tax=Stylonychia lemnae TaxID=5949 RepID=A0A078ARF4_STYLE|nr:UNKNOWN [Stylonychia lemnae]|eukprot:CDW84561.1 UNKNOWN [Stylonychia lemnae]